MYDKAAMNIHALATASGTPPRRVRFYIQQGVLPGPEGLGRGAVYSEKHVEQLVNIRRWQEAGFSLDRIKELISHDAPVDVPILPAKMGVAEVWSRVYLADGLEVHIEASRTGLSAQQIEQLINQINQYYKAIKTPPPGPLPLTGEGV